jgi:hypothetical protein
LLPRSIDFDDDLPPLDNALIAARCASLATCTWLAPGVALSAGHNCACSAAALQQEVSVILDSARRGCLMATGVQVSSAAP